MDKLVRMSPFTNHKYLISFAISGILTFVFYKLRLGLNFEHEFYGLYFTNALDYLSGRLDKSFIFLLTNEPIWLVLNYAVFFINENPNFGILFFYCFAIFVKFFYLLTRTKINKWFFVIFLFFSPNIFLHLRFSLAFSVLLISFMNKNNIFRYILYLTPFIHSSFLLVVPLVIISNNKNYLRAVWLMVVLAAFGYILLLQGLDFSSFLPRQIYSEAYETLDREKSGMGFIIYMLVLLCLYFMSGDSENLRLSKFFILLYILLYFNFHSPQRLLMIGYFFLIPVVVNRVSFWSFIILMLLMLLIIYNYTKDFY